MAGQFSSYIHRILAPGLSHRLFRIKRTHLLTTPPRAARSAQSCCVLCAHALTVTSHHTTHHHRLMTPGPPRSPPAPCRSSCACPWHLGSPVLLAACSSCRLEARPAACNARPHPQGAACLQRCRPGTPCTCFFLRGMRRHPFRTQLLTV